MTGAEVRRKVLERDHYQCQFNQLFGIEHLSGVPCAEELEVHHKTYVSYGSETSEQLITVCVRCHDFITNYVRGLRFAAQPRDVSRSEEDTAAGVNTERNEGEDI